MKAVFIILLIVGWAFGQEPLHPCQTPEDRELGRPFSNNCAREPNFPTVKAKRRKPVRRIGRKAKTVSGRRSPVRS